MDSKTRLRKACDACSIRKVKVSLLGFQISRANAYTNASAISVARHADLALPWIFHARMRGPADAGGLPTATQKH